MQPSGAPRPRRPVWLYTILALSLALNLAIGGFAAGVLSHRAGAPETVRAVRDPGLFRMVAVLPGAHRAALRDALRESRATGGPSLQAAREGLRAAILRPDPAAEDIAAQLAARRTAIAAAAGTLEQALASQIAAMPQDVREDYLRRLSRPVRPKGHRDGPGRGD